MLRFLILILIFFLSANIFFSGRVMASNINKKSEENKQKVSINIDNRFQEIDNFGASGSWSIDVIGEEWEESNKEKIADLLFSKKNGIGLSGWRFHIGAGSEVTDEDIINDRFRRAETFKEGENEPYEWNKLKGQQWFLKAAADHGVKDLIAIAYSPPFWLTKNGHTQPDESVGTTNIEQEKFAEFSKYLVDIIKYFESEENIEFDYLSPINEPYWDWNKSGQEGNRYAIKDIKKLINELHKQLKVNNLTTKLLIPEAGDYTALLDDKFYKKLKAGKENKYDSELEKEYNGKYREYINELIGDKSIRSKISNMLAAHSYWTDYSRKELKSTREILKENLENYNSQTKIWQSEYCVLGEKEYIQGNGRDLGMKPALFVSRTIHYDLTALNTSAWQWWLSVSPYDYKDGLLYTDYFQPGDSQNIKTSKIFWGVGNYSKFIRPGYRRVELNGADDPEGLMGSAYIGPDGGKLVMVFINYSRSEEKVKIDIKDNENNKYDKFVPYITSEKKNLESLEPVLGKNTFEIPGKSIITYVSQTK